jgi:integrase
MARQGGTDRGLFERPTGSGIWWIRYHDADGIERRERVGGKGLARKRYMQRKTEIVEGRFFPTVRQRPSLFDDLLDEYREAKRREGKAVMASNIGYARLRERFGGRRAGEIASDDVDRWRRDLAETMAPATVNLHLCLLRAILRHAVRTRRLKASELPQIAALKTNNKLVRYLTGDEERRLLEALPERLRLLVVVAIHTGMRKGELLNLTWDDIDFVSGTITVREGKSGEGRRLPMSATARRALLALREPQQQSMRALILSGDGASAWVFSAPRGGFLMNLNRDWYRALKRAELRDFRFHDLRHTFASRLVMAGVDLYRVQTLMGHKMPAMTLRYAHLSPQHLRAAVELLDEPGAKPWTAAVQ